MILFPASKSYVLTHWNFNGMHLEGKYAYTKIYYATQAARLAHGRGIRWRKSSRTTWRAALDDSQWTLERIPIVR